MEKTANKNSQTIDNVDLHARIAEQDKTILVLRMENGKLKKQVEDLKVQLTEKAEVQTKQSGKHIMLSNVLHNGQLFKRGTEIKEPTLIKLFLEKGIIS